MWPYFFSNKLNYLDAYLVEAGEFVVIWLSVKNRSFIICVPSQCGKNVKLKDVEGF